MKAQLLLAGLLALAGLASPGVAIGANSSAAGCLTSTDARTTAPPSLGTPRWSVNTLADLDGLNNSGTFGSLGPDRAALVTTSGGRTWFTRTLDAGDSWSQPRALTSASVEITSASAAFTGAHIDVVSQPTSYRVLYRHSADRGQTWSPAVRMTLGASATVARGPDGMVAITAVRSDQFVIRVSTDGGVSFGPQRIVGRYTPDDGCVYDPGLASVAIAADTIVVGFWRNSGRFVVRRSTNEGESWTPGKTLHSRKLSQGTNALVAHGTRVLAVYQDRTALISRFSSNAGATWSTPTIVAVNASYAEPSWSGGQWQIVDTRANRVRYRSSANGRVWSAPVALIDDPDLEPLPYGVASLTSATLVAFLTYDWNLDAEHIRLASRKSDTSE
jgi:hypothetical protein